MELWCFFSKVLHLVFPDGEQEIIDTHCAEDKTTIQGSGCCLIKMLGVPIDSNYGLFVLLWRKKKKSQKSSFKDLNKELEQNSEPFQQSESHENHHGGHFLGCLPFTGPQAQVVKVLTYITLERHKGNKTEIVC